MKTWQACVLGLGATWSACVGVAACSSTSGSFTDGGTDSGADVTLDQMSMFDVNLPDQNQIQPDNLVPDSPITDGGSEGSIFDSGLVGNCSPVNGPACDIVKQNCPSNQECVIVLSNDAAVGATTECVKTTSTEVRVAGQSCCPNDPKGNECKPGLTCIGNDCVGDASSGAQCAPACCPATDAGPGSNNCGTSMEGYPGQCDITLVNPSNEDPLFTACTYSSKCFALGVAPCGPGFECFVENEAGASECQAIFGPDGGSTGEPPGGSCDSYACAAGLGCILLGSSDAGATCLWQCYLGGTTPFDAGLLDAAVGHGGCQSGYTCEGVTGYPPWLGVCAAP